MSCPCCGGQMVNWNEGIWFCLHCEQFTDFNSNGGG